MTEFPLPNGQFTLIDDDIYQQIKKYKWRISERGYVSRNEMKAGRKQKTIYLHKLVCPSTYKTDHRNGNKLDNQRNNLRACTQAQNIQGKSIQKNNRSGFKGVYAHSKNGTWIAQINPQGKAVYLGTFHKPLHAAMAYDIAARDLYGEFAKLNFQPLNN